MIKIIAIIGDGGTGKSTLIRHITGVARTKDITLTQLSGRNVSVHVRPQSPQEPQPKYCHPNFVDLLLNQELNM